MHLAIFMHKTPATRVNFAPRSHIGSGMMRGNRGNNTVSRRVNVGVSALITNPAVLARRSYATAGPFAAPGGIMKRTDKEDFAIRCHDCDYQQIIQSGESGQAAWELHVLASPGCKRGSMLGGQVIKADAE